MNKDFNFYVKRERPEEIYKSLFDYYTKERIFQYANSKSMKKIQKRITLRALEILDLKNKNSIILDAGCGPGFASIFLKDLGYKKVIALDLIHDFLKFYDFKDVIPLSADMCFIPFRSHIYDAIISISALQWIFRDINSKSMELKLINMISYFYYVLKPESKAIIQFYPKNRTIMDHIGKIIIKNSDFNGNFIIDNPNNPKKRKIFLLLNKN
ncbi:MAG: class I SAM-dependent methyltransferase [Promethearchaeota archaeon]